MVIIMKKLEIRDLHVNAGEKEILKGIDLDINTGEIHAIMGPNGNGKSTLLQTIMGHPAYTVTKGSILFDGEDVLSMSVDERSKKGLFLAMQYPKEIAGVTNSDFLRAAINARLEKNISLFKFIKEIEGNIAKLKMKEDLAHRFVNDGFSGGEKKRNEILQMMMLHPSIAMLDEIDSGLDVDAINEDLSLLNIVIAANQGQNGGLTGAGRAYKGHRLSRLHREGHALEHPLIRLIGEPHILKFNFSFDMLQLDGIRLVYDFRLLIQHGENLFCGGKGALQHIKLLCQGLNGVKEFIQVHIEGNHNLTGHHRSHQGSILNVALAAEIE